MTKTKFLVAAFACLSVLGAAQQSEKKNDSTAKEHEVKAPRDMATGQASGRQANHKAESDASAGAQMKNVSAGDVNGDQAAVRESPSKASTGLRESPTKASTGKTAVADVDGDGAADKTTASSDVKAPRDAATGQASGKRQHEPVKVTKEVEPASKEKK